MKTSTTVESPKETVKSEISLPQNKQEQSKFYNITNAVLSSATVYALLVFILLNIMLLMVAGPNHRAQSAKDESLSKLHQVIFNSSYETYHSGPWPWWIGRAYLNANTPDIVIMGDSQVNAALFQADAVFLKKSVDCTSDRDCPAFKSQLENNGASACTTTPQNNLRIVNLGIGGAMPSDHYMIARSLFTPKQHPKLVIITLSPRSFLDATLPCASATETFQFFSPFANLENLVDYSFNNPAQKFFWLIQRKFALFACRQDIQLSVQEFIENLFRKLYKTKTNNLQDNSSPNQSMLQSIYTSNGLVPKGSSVVGPIPLTNFLDNKPEYARRFAQMKPETLNAQTAFFAETLAYLKTLGVPVIVVDMPMLQPVRALLPEIFWDKYRLGLTNSCLDNNAYWLDLDATDEFPQREFLDYVHLNASGSTDFLGKLANYINKTRVLRSCLQ